MSRIRLPSRAFFRRLGIYLSWKVRFGFDGAKLRHFQPPSDPEAPNMTMRSIHSENGMHFLVARKATVKKED